ncbi:toprim domain-containing protein [Brevundimonas sp. NPDC092305]|uniref:toprim domain-containing protein n=1 Tax=Brevundimonas sp. NPDC092305 TaxID=3363957 RepID=UPI0037F3F7E8
MASLHAIVDALGGEVWDGGRRAAVRAPGHSPRDRSVALMLSGDRVVIHAFGGTDWREVSLHLRDLGLIDSGGRLTGAGSSAFWPSPPAPPARPDRLDRVRAARMLWDEARPLRPGSAALAHLVLRLGAMDAAAPDNLRHHPGAPVSVFGVRTRRLQALIARICDAAGALTAVEIVYLRPDGRAATELRLPRKTVGVVPPGSAVRLWPAAPDLLVGEGVMTTLSASRRFGLPGWALLSAGSLARWVSPPEVRRVLIAADRGRAGEAAAGALRDRLSSRGVAADVVLPPPGAGDWNDMAVAQRREEEGR